MMQLRLVRSPLPDCTPGKLYIDGVEFCDTMEDIDRGLLSTHPLWYLQDMKIAGETCIPYGTYPVLITLSEKFRRLMPLIANVPAFSGIRIHWGDTTKDVRGCVAIGKSVAPDRLTGSVDTFNEFFPMLRNGLINNQTCAIEIVKLEVPPFTLQPGQIQPV